MRKSKMSYVELNIVCKAACSDYCYQPANRLVGRIKILFLSLLIFLLSIPDAYSQWFWQRPLPTGNRLTDIKFINENIICAVGEEGTFLKSTDGGESWNSYSLGHRATFLGLHFINENTGIACGDSGIVLKTTNGGVNWVRKNVPYNIVYQKIFFPSSDTGYIVGYQNSIIKTINRGETWTGQSSNVATNFLSVNFLNNNTGVAGGIQSVVKTTNGGANWEMMPVQFKSFLNFIRSIKIFNDSIIIFGANSDKDFFKSKDGGNTWVEIPFPISFYNDWGVSINEMSFIDDNTGFAGVDLGFVFKTYDGGNNWITDSTLIQYNNPIGIIFSLNTYGTQNIITAGNGSNIAKSTDAGNTWEIKAGFQQHLFKNHFFNESTGIAVGNKGEIWKTTDAGNNWIQKQGGTVQNLKGLYFINDLTGYSCGDTGTILKTMDAGESWSSLSSGIINNLTNIYFFNSQTGYATGFNGRVLKTINAGDNWFTQNSSYNGELYETYFHNDQTGYIIADFRILRTTNGGNNWTSSNQARGFSIDFKDSLIGIVCGGSGAIFLTTNGGVNWILNQTSYFSNLLSIKYLNDSEVISVGMDGLALKSSNSGYNWTRMTIGTRNNLNNLTFTDDQTGYVIGDYGTVLKTTNGGIVFIKKISSSIPEGFILHQNYPNPFNPLTKIKFLIPIRMSAFGKSYIKLKVFDITGKEIVVLADEKFNPGEYEVTFNAALYGLSSGIYFYSLITEEGVVQTKKMILLR
jgi:photosystem II stability/assembly factor-like uncharacterized protein